MMYILPSKVNNDYRVHYGKKEDFSDVYLEIEVSFELMDQVFGLMANLVDQKFASKVSCTTKMSHFYFHMNKACIAIHFGENGNQLEEMVRLLISEPYRTKKIVFN